jgi:hypothetical protein
MTQTTKVTNFSGETTLFNECAAGLKLALSTALKDHSESNRPLRLKRIDIAMYFGPEIYSISELQVSGQSRTMLIFGIDYKEGQTFSLSECGILLHNIWEKVQLMIQAGLLVSEGEVKGASSDEPVQAELKLGVISLEKKPAGVHVKRCWSKHLAR